MKLKLNNIGIIKQAEIELNGLSVIAGKNDSGKSTVGKVLYALVKSVSRGNIQASGVRNLQQLEFNKAISSLFNKQISYNGKIDFFYEKTSFKVEITDNLCEKFTIPKEYETPSLQYKYRPIFIETPFIWNMFSTLKAIKSLESNGDEMEFHVSNIVKDLHFVLSQEIKIKESTIKLNIKKIIDGEFVADRFGNYSFSKENKNIALSNTAMGIKYFGLLQVLSDNNHFYDSQILILDEPEVHLHPTWQLKLAQVIVFLVQKGMKILVNSHSPYMIEALQRYAKKEQISSKFYLADDGSILPDDDSLSKIFEKLSEPSREFDAMDSEIFNG